MHRLWTVPRSFVLGDGRTVLIREIEREDAELVAEFLRGLCPETSYMRFMYTKGYPDCDAGDWVEFDRGRTLALLAETTINGWRRSVADVRCIRDSDHSNSAELGIVVADDFQRRGLGSALLCAMSTFASSRGVNLLHAVTLHENMSMRGLALKFGFKSRRSDPDGRELSLERLIGSDGSTSELGRSGGVRVP